MGYRIHHRWDERGVVVESGVFDTDGDIPEGFSTEAPAAPDTSGTAVRVPVPVFDAKPLRQWEEPEAPSDFQTQIDERPVFVDEDDLEDAGFAGADSDSDGPVGEAPPKGGAGATRQAWAEYATANGVEVTDEMDRGDIIAACEAADVPTE